MHLSELCAIKSVSTLYLFYKCIIANICIRCGPVLANKPVSCSCEIQLHLAWTMVNPFRLKWHDSRPRDCVFCVWIGHPKGSNREGDFQSVSRIEFFAVYTLAPSTLDHHDGLWSPLRNGVSSVNTKEGSLPSVDPTGFGPGNCKAPQLILFPLSFIHYFEISTMTFWSRADVIASQNTTKRLHVLLKVCLLIQ